MQTAATSAALTTSSSAAVRIAARSLSFREVLSNSFSAGKGGEAGTAPPPPPPPQAAGSSSSYSSPLIRYNPACCPRSPLFVPCSKPRALTKALQQIPADCFILDLEDSVGPGEAKREARKHLLRFIEEEVPAYQEAFRQRRAELRREGEADQQPQEGGPSDLLASLPEDWVPTPRFIVRVNSPDDQRELTMLDMEVVQRLGPRVEGVAVPKVGPRTFDFIQRELFPMHQVWALFETPEGVASATEICRSGHYKAAVMGYNDLRTELGLPLENNSNGALSPPLQHAALTVMLAAKAAKLWWLDGVYNDPTNTGGFKTAMQQSLAMGFQGRTLIHPSQVKPANDAYAPEPEAVSFATELLEAVKASKGGVASVKGVMVEALHARQAKETLTMDFNAKADEEWNQLLTELSSSGRCDSSGNRGGR